MTKFEQVYKEWRSSLKSPDDSIFYYHPDLERILLGLSIYTLSSEPLIQKLRNLEHLSVLNIYTTELITAWIDEDGDAFEKLFQLTMTVAEAYLIGWAAAGKSQPSKKKETIKLGNFFTYAVASGGDMNPKLAQSLLDDISTDSKKIYSPKIQEFGTKLLKLMQIYGPDIPPASLSSLNGW